VTLYASVSVATAAAALLYLVVYFLVRIAVRGGNLAFELARALLNLRFGRVRHVLW
jgi:hypothetical protein